MVSAKIDVQFVGTELPQRTDLLRRFMPALAVVRERPLVWASIATYPSRAGARYASRLLPDLVEDFEFKATSTRYPEGSTLWARFTGET